MNYLETYQSRKLCDVPETDLKQWVIAEVTDLANDFGQKIDNEMVLHISRRLLSAFKTKFRSWYVGEIHAAFQNGMAGAYGTVHKVTVKNLFAILRGAQNQMAGKKAAAAEEESDRNTANFNTKNEPLIEFITWATTNTICLEFAAPDWNPIKKQSVSPGVKALLPEYIKAKNSNTLQGFKRKLKDESTIYKEQQESRKLEEMPELRQGI